MLRRSVFKSPIFSRSFYSSASRAMASPFSEAVVSSMRALYPECLADKSFDNTGLLLEAPFYSQRRNLNSVLLTIDLTKAVAEEVQDAPVQGLPQAISPTEWAGNSHEFPLRGEA